MMIIPTSLGNYNDSIRHIRHSQHAVVIFIIIITNYYYHKNKSVIKGIPVFLKRKGSPFGSFHHIIFLTINIHCLIEGNLSTEPKGE